VVSFIKKHQLVLCLLELKVFDLDLELDLLERFLSSLSLTEPSLIAIY
jgi:hypothetical protein